MGYHHQRVCVGGIITWSSQTKGVTPVRHSYERMPLHHQSTSNEWPAFLMISGARYSGVPHSVHVFSLRICEGRGHTTVSNLGGEGGHTT